MSCVIGPIPPTTIYQTWSENMEIWSADDDALMDLSDVTEITLKLRDKVTRFDELVLTMSDGDITIPSSGIIQWRVEATRMIAIEPKTYEVIMLFEASGDIISFLGSVSILE